MMFIKDWQCTRRYSIRIEIPRIHYQDQKCSNENNQTITELMKNSAEYTINTQFKIIRIHH
jgi:hypothetical protein